MITKEFRRLMIDYPSKVRRVVLTDQQIKLFKFVERHGVPVTSGDVAVWFDISVATASRRLLKLKKGGYLKANRTHTWQGSSAWRYEVAI